MSTPQKTVGDYLVLGRLGKGSFAIVYHAQHRITGAEVAIKSVAKEGLSKRLLENLESEIRIMKSLRHSNIVQLIDVIHSERYIHLVLEYCRGGDLSAFIKRRKFVAEPVAQNLLAQLASGLRYCETFNLIHRDLKPQNLLLLHTETNALVLKIADFGFARVMQQPQDLASTLCGSPLYMAPEILQRNKYDAKSDLWSVGAILWEMLTGRTPFQAENYLQLLERIERNPLRYPSDAQPITAECQHLLSRLLTVNPLDRISFQEFFAHPFVLSAPAEVSDAGSAAEKQHPPASTLAQVLAQQPPFSPGVLTRQPVPAAALAPVLPQKATLGASPPGGQHPLQSNPIAIPPRLPPAGPAPFVSPQGVVRPPASNPFKISSSPPTGTSPSGTTLVRQLSSGNLRTPPVRGQSSEDLEAEYVILPSYIDVLASKDQHSRTPPVRRPSSISRSNSQSTPPKQPELTQLLSSVAPREALGLLPLQGAGSALFPSLHSESLSSPTVAAFLPSSSPTLGFSMPPSSPGMAGSLLDARTSTMLHDIDITAARSYAVALVGDAYSEKGEANLALSVYQRALDGLSLALSRAKQLPTPLLAAVGAIQQISSSPPNAALSAWAAPASQILRVHQLFEVYVEKAELLDRVATSLPDEPPVSIDRLIYDRAIMLAQDAAADETLQNYARSIEQYRFAQLLLEFLANPDTSDSTEHDQHTSHQLAVRIAKQISFLQQPQLTHS